jgi:hypothetical protein
MNLDALREALVDLHARWHHDLDVARSRAETIMVVIEQHLTGEPALVLDCDTEMTFVEPISEPEPEV